MLSSPGVGDCSARTQTGRGRDRRLSVAGLFVLLVGVLIGCVFAPAAVAKPSPYYASDRVLVNHYAVIEGAKLDGVSLPGGANHFIRLVESPHDLIEVPFVKPNGMVVKENALAVTPCHDVDGGAVGPATGCTIEIAVEPHTNGELRTTIAHEVFHVFQAVMAGTLENFNREYATKQWLVEGSAAWVEADLTGPSPGVRHQWKVYLNSPEAALFTRTYTAVGFFGHLASSGISPWTRFPAMFAATSSAAAYEAAVGGNKLFLNSEASVFFREPAFGPPWDQKGPAVPSKAEVGYKPSLEEPEEAPVLLHPAPYTDAPYELSLKKMTTAEPVLEVHTISGELRLHSTKGPAVDVAEPPERLLLCAHAKACKECPVQSPEKVVNFEKGDLAITAGPKGAKVELIPETTCLLKARPCRGLLSQGDFTGTTEEYENVQGECLYTPAMTVGENGYRYPVDPEDHHGGLVVLAIYPYLLKGVEDLHGLSPAPPCVVAERVDIGTLAYVGHTANCPETALFYWGFLDVRNVQFEVETEAPDVVSLLEQVEHELL